MTRILNGAVVDLAERQGLRAPANRKVRSSSGKSSREARGPTPASKEGAKMLTPADVLHILKPVSDEFRAAAETQDRVAELVDNTSFLARARMAEALPHTLRDSTASLPVSASTPRVTMPHGC